MALSLRDLVSRGYDVGIGEALLPMINSHEMYPNWEEQMLEAYLHLKKRVTPEWARDEPAEVVAAAKSFVDAYDEICNARHLQQTQK